MSNVSKTRKDFEYSMGWVPISNYMRYSDAWKLRAKHPNAVVDQDIERPEPDNYYVSRRIHA